MKPDEFSETDTGETTPDMREVGSSSLPRPIFCRRGLASRKGARRDFWFPRWRLGVSNCDVELERESCRLQAFSGGLAPPAL
jgi:hypothetical protein